LKTEDGGGTWTSQSGAGTKKVRSLFVKDARRAWAVGAEGLLLKTDDGVEWSVQSIGFTQAFSGIQFVDDLNGWLLASNHQSWRTVDGGSTWTPLPGSSHSPSVCFYFLNQDEGFGACRYISRTVNGGKKWKFACDTNWRTVWEITFVENRYGWACGNYGLIVRSGRGGENWEMLSSRRTHAVDTVRGLCFPDRRHGWFVGGSGMILRYRDEVPHAVSSGDYDGDGKAHLAVFRPETGLWSVRGLGRSYYGRERDVPVAGDYNGDGYADVAVWRPDTGLWAVRGITRFYLGAIGALPAPGDYDGDGTCEGAVFDRVRGRWEVRGTSGFYFGGSADLPVPGDYDGDGKVEAAVFRPATGMWAARGYSRWYFGEEGDVPLAGVYRWYAPGEASARAGPSFRARSAVYRSAVGLWKIQGVTRFYLGDEETEPVVGDFEGKGLDQAGVFRPATGLWAVPGVTRAYFGESGDYPATR